MATIRERTDKHGNTTFQAQVRIQGHPPQSATFERKSDAKHWAAKVETEIRSGKSVRSQRTPAHSLNEAIERYKNSVLVDKARGGEDERAPLRWWADQLGVMSLTHITPDHISASVAEFRKRVTERNRVPAPATVLRYVMVLSHVFNVAIKEWGWCEHSPVKNVKRPKVVNERTRYLNEAERNSLLVACKTSPSRDLYLVVVIAISTGMRKGEIMGLRWRDIHESPEGKFVRIHLTRTKNDRSRFVPLAAEALELLRARKAQVSSQTHGNSTDNLIFPSDLDAEKPVDLRTPWETALRKSGIKNFRFHDLRHTTASYLAMEGVSLLAISKVLGHRTTKMTERYAHLAESHIDEAVRKMNEKKFGGEKVAT